jgi:hypothetical protein
MRSINESGSSAVWVHLDSTYGSSHATVTGPTSGAWIVARRPSNVKLTAGRAGPRYGNNNVAARQGSAVRKDR